MIAPSWKFRLTALCSLILLIVAWFSSLTKAQERDAILSPPYFGTKSLTAVFDHEFPTRYAGQPPDVANSVVNRDGTRQIDPDNNPCARYSGHAGIDYGLFYDYVLAAHDGQVENAGWGNPENRRAGLGLRVEIEITLANQDRYKTRYGHLSTLFVETSQNVASGDLIGISGNTGNSSGPHLHFEVLKLHIDAIFYPVNPYGWNSSDPDPWENAGRPASTNVWRDIPSITSTVPGRCSYPTGTPLVPNPDPPLMPDFSHPERLIVDDFYNGRFSYSGPGWQLRLCANAGNDYCFGPEGQATHYYNRNAPAHAYTEWRVYTADLLGYYDVYAFVPSRESTTTLAYYEIRQSNRILSAAIDQSRFHLTPGIRQWAYLGRYNFSQRTGNPALEQWVRLYDTPNVDAETFGQSVAADAVVFVMANGPPSLVRSIAIPSDDAGPNPSCDFNTTYYEIYLGHCHNGTQIVSGFRYSNVDIPAGATIIRAVLELTLDGTYSGISLQLRLYGHNNPTSPTFTPSNRPDQRSPLTQAWVWWNVPATDIWHVYTKRHSPNLGPIVQELVNHPNWIQGQSALTFIVKPAPGFSGNQHRRVMAYERDQGGGLYAARLLVWYTTGN